MRTMKKLGLIILLLATATEMPAQKWLKSLGNTLDKVEKAANQLTGNSTGLDTSAKFKSTTFTYANVQVVTTLPQFTVAVDGVKRISRECGTISLILTNTSSEDVRLYGLSVMKSLTDSKGNDYSSYGKWEIRIGNQTIRRYGTDDDYI